MSPSSQLGPHDQTALRRRRRRLRALAFFAVILVLAAIAAAVYYRRPLLAHVPQPVADASTWLTELRDMHLPPQELRGAQFISEDAYGRLTAYRPGWFAYARAPLAYAPAAAHAAADPLNAHLLLRDFAVPPGGSRAAFSISLSGTAPKSPHDWQVDVEDMNGTNRPVGIGLAPFFVDESHVGRFTDTGIVVTDLDHMGTTTATSTPIHPGDFRTFSHYPRVSPDGRLVAYYDATTKRIVVLNARAAFATVTEYPGQFTSFALANDGLYLITAGVKVTQISRYSFSDGTTRLIYTLPSALRITDIRTR